MCVLLLQNPIDEQTNIDNINDIYNRGHYVWIKDLSKFFKNINITNVAKKQHICNRCFSRFGQECLLEKHQHSCYGPCNNLSEDELLDIVHDKDDFYCFNCKQPQWS